MMVPDWLKPIAGVLVGWVLGLGTDGLRRWFLGRRYHRAIYEELRDVHSTLKTRILVMEHSLKDYISQKTITGIPTPIGHPIFDKWFAEIATSFTEDERLGFMHIDSAVDDLNWHFSIMRDNWDFFHVDATVDRVRLGKVIRSMENTYGNARQIDLMIGFLLEGRGKHNIRDERQAALIEQVYEDVKAEMSEWIRQAKTKRK